MDKFGFKKNVPVRPCAELRRWEGGWRGTGVGFQGVCVLWRYSLWWWWARRGSRHFCPRWCLAGSRCQGPAEFPRTRRQWRRRKWAPAKIHKHHFQSRSGARGAHFSAPNTLLQEMAGTKVSAGERIAKSAVCELSGLNGMRRRSSHLHAHWLLLHGSIMRIEKNFAYGQVSWW